MGAVLLELGCPHEAMKNIREAKEILSAKFPRGYPVAWQILMLQARAQSALADHDAAVATAQEVERLMRQELAKNTPRAQQALVTLAKIRAVAAKRAPPAPWPCRGLAP
jgi:hypothetical protein